MNIRSKQFVVAATLATLCLPAFAYVDPVSGAMLLQIVVSGVTGFLLVFRRAVANFFRKVFRRTPKDSNRSV